MDDGMLQGLDVEPFRIRKFEVGDLVFAKVKGYPPWPSMINQIETITAGGGKEKTRYNVYFYGTHQSSLLRVSSLFHYDTYAKTIVQKYGRNVKFHEALEELELEMMAKIAYLKDIRTKPDSSWLPGFNSACDSLLSDIQKEGPPTFDDVESHGGSSVSDEINMQCSEVNSSDEEEEVTSMKPSHKETPNTCGYEVTYMEKVPLPDTNECFLVVSLKFDKEWVEAEIKKITDEDHMKNCYVRIDPLPPQYANLELGRTNLPATIERLETSPIQAVADGTYEERLTKPYDWRNSLMNSVNRRYKNRSQRPTVKKRKWGSSQPFMSRLRKNRQEIPDEDRIRTLRHNRPQSFQESSDDEKHGEVDYISHVKDRSESESKTSSKKEVNRAKKVGLLHKASTPESRDNHTAVSNKRTETVSVTEKTSSFCGGKRVQCPVRGQKFDTSTELSTHAQSEHSGGMSPDSALIQSDLARSKKVLPKVVADSSVKPDLWRSVADNLFDEPVCKLKVKLSSDELFDNLLSSSRTENPSAVSKQTDLRKCDSLLTDDSFGVKQFGDESGSDSLSDVPESMQSLESLEGSSRLTVSSIFCNGSKQKRSNASH